MELKKEKPKEKNKVENEKITWDLEGETKVQQYKIEGDDYSKYRVIHGFS